MKSVYFSLLLFFLLNMFACGKTIVDKAYHSESKITNSLQNPIKIIFYNDGKLDNINLMPNNSFTSKIEFSDAPTPIFYNSDSITIQFLVDGKMKSDLNCNKQYIISQYPNYCNLDTINIFRSGSRVISSTIDNKSFHEYKVDTLDYIEAK